MFKRKITSIFFVVITLCFILCFFFGTTCVVRVEAANNPYPSTQDVDGDGYYEVPCTRFAWQQVYDNLGVALPAWGNAVNWWQSAKNAGYSTGSTPKSGSIAVWSGDYYGHVAYVTSGLGNTFTVNEGGRTDLDTTSSHGVKYGYTLINAVGASRPYDSGKTLLGFIYPNASKPANSGAYYSSAKVDWTDNWNAGLSGRIENPGRENVSSVGAYLWESTGKLLLNHSENCGLTTSYVDQTLNIVGETSLKQGLKQGMTYTYQLWANVGGKTVYSNKGSFSISDSTAPTILNVSVKDITSDGYTVVCNATDNVNVVRAQFPTWTSLNGQDDLIKDWNINSKSSGSKNGNSFTYRVRVIDHNNETGEYITHIYAFDAAGNNTSYKVDTVNVPPRVVENPVSPQNVPSKPASADLNIPQNSDNPVPTESDIPIQPDNPVSTESDMPIQPNNDNPSSDVMSENLDTTLTVIDDELGETVISKSVIDEGMVYRMYNPNSGEHMYTKDAGERDAMVSWGWNYEEDASYPTISSSEEDAVPVYRVYNPNLGLHHYTMDKNEAIYLKNLGYNYEGISYYVYDKTSSKGNEQYRLYNPNDGQHHWTVSASERDFLVSIGWNDEGVAWRVR